MTLPLGRDTTALRVPVTRVRVGRGWEPYPSRARWRRERALEHHLSHRRPARTARFLRTREVEVGG